MKSNRFLMTINGADDINVFNAECVVKLVIRKSVILYAKESIKIP